ncbi:ABC transporter permease [Anaerolineaceae bacterium oral taxon 439]|nr:ABC transporter permease [Anaerolineaceae bacterium oral taxon 439]
MNYLHNMITDGLAFGIPLFIMAVGAIYSEKSGVTNLAVEGFQGFGAFCGAVLATILALYAGLSTQTILYIALAMALVGGALYAILHALLCIQFKAEQVISGVVINILGISLTTFLTSQISGVLFGSASNKFTLGVSDRFTVPGLSSVPVLGAVFTNVYPFEVILLVISLFAWYLMYKTRFGMRLRACGDNPQAVDAAGGNVARTRFIAVMISGGLSGIGGMCFAYSLLSQFSPSIYLGYGYLAIAAMIFGNWNIVLTFFVCLFFGIARAGGYQLCLFMGLSSQYTNLFMTIPYILTLLLLLFFSKRNHPPRAIGEAYDKGKR